MPAGTTAVAALRLTLLARDGGVAALLSDGRTLAELGTAQASLEALAALCGPSMRCRPSPTPRCRQWLVASSTKACRLRSAGICAARRPAAR
ncbi:MAG: hypothetical protein U1F67_19325 [Rubrivivax sp.]